MTAIRRYTGSAAPSEPALRRACRCWGIRRGLQEMNVAFGGSLHPEIRELPGRMNHRACRDLESGEGSS